MFIHARDTDTCRLRVLSDMSYISNIDNYIIILIFGGGGGGGFMYVYTRGAFLFSKFVKKVT